MKGRIKLTRVFYIGMTIFLIMGVLSFGIDANGKDTLIIGVPSTPTGIDPDLNAEPAGSDIQGNLYDWGISLKFQPSTQRGMGDVMVPDFMGKMQPGLIERWELAPDYSSLTCHLRKGIKSAWGNELNTDDILWKWKRHIHLKGNGLFFMGVMNFSRDPLKNIKIIDKYTFEMIPDKPAHVIELMWSNLYYPIWDSTEASKHATKDDPYAHDWVATHGCGYGSYYITEWRSGEQIILEANPKAWRGQPAFKKLIFKVIPESSSRVAMIKDGTIDVALKLSPREIESLKGAPGVRVINLQGNLDMYVLFNQSFEPFKNKYARQAIQWATPQSDIVKLAYFGQAIPWKSPIPSMYPASYPENFQYSYDLKKAKELLKKGGYPNGFTVDLYYDADWAAHETTAVLMKDSLARIDIKVNLRKTPAGSFNNGVMAKRFPFSLWNDYPCIHDPFYSYQLMYPSWHAHNYVGYKNPEADRLMKEGNDIVDREKRYEYIRKLNKVILEDVPEGWVVEQNYTCAIRDSIKGFNWDVSNNLRYDFFYPSDKEPTIRIPH